MCLLLAKAKVVLKLLSLFFRRRSLCSMNKHSIHSNPMHGIEVLLSFLSSSKSPQFIAKNVNRIVFHAGGEIFGQAGLAKLLLVLVSRCVLTCLVFAL